MGTALGAKGLRFGVRGWPGLGPVARALSMGAGAPLGAACTRARCLFGDRVQFGDAAAGWQQEEALGTAGRREAGRGGDGSWGSCSPHCPPCSRGQLWGGGRPHPAPNTTGELRLTGGSTLTLQCRGTLTTSWSLWCLFLVNQFGSRFLNEPPAGDLGLGTWLVG